MLKRDRAQDSSSASATVTMFSDTHQYKLFITTGVMFIITKKRSETSLSMLHCPSYRLRLNSFSAKAGAPLRPNTVRKALKSTGFLGIEGRGVLVLPINFKSDTQTEEMGVGTARLLFQVFSTLIYIYRHLTNPPQSPNYISQLYFSSLYICISLCCLYLPFST